MFCVPATERVFWRTDNCTVWVGCDDDDALRRALGADPAADVLDLVCAHVGEIMARGERTWL
jgi:hypothetical protein